MVYRIRSDRLCVSLLSLIPTVCRKAAQKVARIEHGLTIYTVPLHTRYNYRGGVLLYTSVDWPEWRPNDEISLRAAEDHRLSSVQCNIPRNLVLLF